MFCPGVNTAKGGVIRPFFLTLLLARARVKEEAYTGDFRFDEGLHFPSTMISFKIVIGSLFGLLVVAVAVLGVFFYQDSQDRAIVAAQVSRGYQAIAKTEEIYSAFKNMQLQAGGMADQNDLSLSADDGKATQILYVRLAELRDLITNNDLRREIDSLEALIQQYTQGVDSLKFFAAGSEAGRTFMVTRHIGVARRIEVKVRDLKAAEAARLAYFTLALDERVASFMRTLLVLMIVIAILLVATFLTVRYIFNKRKAAEDQIKDALQAEVELNTLKSAFVTLASHEFRTPLTTILSSVFLLERYSFGVSEEKVAKHLARIKSSVNNLTSILDEFLSVTKIEEGRVQPNIEDVDLPGLLGEICNDLQTFAKPGQMIHYSHAGVREVKTDPVLIGNIVQNIVTNSIKYSSENSAIYVSSAVDSKIYLAVKDNGIGIPAADQKHLFARFYRASNAGSVQGTGLGLHIMQHYVKMLNGSVRLQSEVGKGTRVEVTLDPVTRAEPRYPCELPNHTSLLLRNRRAGRFWPSAIVWFERFIS